jgi:hypothetical protein
LDTVNSGEQQILGLASLSNSKKGTLITLSPTYDDKPAASLIGVKAAGYESRLTLGLSALYPEFTTIFWRNIHWARSGLIRPVQVQVVEGLDAAKVNAALDNWTSKMTVHP